MKKLTMILLFVLFIAEAVKSRTIFTLGDLTKILLDIILFGLAILLFEFLLEKESKE